MVGILRFLFIVVVPLVVVALGFAALAGVYWLFRRLSGSEKIDRPSN